MQEVNVMARARDLRRSDRGPMKPHRSFASVLLDETLALLRNGKPATARLVLRDLINTTVGFEQLAVATKRPVRSLQRMLTAKANPGMDDLSMILAVLASNFASNWRPGRSNAHLVGMIAAASQITGSSDP